MPCLILRHAVIPATTYTIPITALYISKGKKNDVAWICPQKNASTCNNSDKTKQYSYGYEYIMDNFHLSISLAISTI